MYASPPLMPAASVGAPAQLAPAAWAPHIIDSTEAAPRRDAEERPPMLSIAQALWLRRGLWLGGACRAAMRRLR